VFARGSIARIAAAEIRIEPAAQAAPPEADDVRSPSREAASVLSNADGDFTLKVPAGKLRLRIIAAGFESLRQELVLRPGENRHEFLLRRTRGNSPFATVVRADPPHQGQQTSLRGEELTTLPGSLGDPFRVMGLLPGVATPVPLLPVFVVRGASPGMNGFFLDGMRVPQLFHLLVGGGIAHARLVDQIDFYPGAYDASLGRYGGGIIDGKTRGARADGYHGELEIKLYDISALAELRRHAQRYPDGVLAEDREALRVVATCRQGLADEAARLRTSFLQRWPSSVHAARVRAACGETASP
jgi:hypothetical protein